MNKRLYNMMDWAQVEEIVYGESLHPEEILGPHTVSNSTLVQAFFPGAKSVTLLIDGEETSKGKRVKEEIEMDEADENGFFAALLPGKNRSDYSYKVNYQDKKSVKLKEVYTGKLPVSEEEAAKLVSGAEYRMFELMGAHVKDFNGVRGVSFLVWAPNALRVSVVGQFNDWNGLANQMSLLGDTGLFNIFIPGLDVDEEYKYEILCKNHEKVMRNDPFSVKLTLGDYNSIVENLNGFKWTDEKFIDKRDKSSIADEAVNIYELDFKTFSDETTAKKITHIAKYVKDMGYTHVNLMPMMEYSNPDCNGFSTTNYFAISNKICEPKDFMKLVNELHKSGIGVILSVNFNSFDENEFGMGHFDGTCLYEYSDTRKSIHGVSKQFIFDYGKAEIAAILISCAAFWAEVYHIDGIMLNDVTSMLYLDYYRENSWLPNIYGGNENLEAIAFIRRLNKVLHKEFPGFITIAYEESGFTNATIKDGMSKAEMDESLGFDLTINGGFHVDALGYIQYDPIERSAHHTDITNGSVYQFCENYLMTISHSDVDFNKGGLITRMPGDENAKFANFKAIYAYMMFFPGKKFSFMGQEFANENSYDGKSILQWDELEKPLNKSFAAYVKAVNEMYSNRCELYDNDFDAEGFSWINSISANENVIVFTRKSNKKNKFLYFVINFANVSYERYQIGVPCMGKYVEIFNSDDEEYGGKGFVNKRLASSKKVEYDELEDSIRVKLAPLSACVFEYLPYTKDEMTAIKMKEEEKKAKIEERLKKKDQLLKEKNAIRQKAKADLIKKLNACNKNY